MFQGWVTRHPQGSIFSMYWVLKYLTAWQLRGETELTSLQILVKCIRQRVGTFIGYGCSVLEQIVERWLFWLRFMLECIKCVWLVLAAVNRTLLPLANWKLTCGKEIISTWCVIESIDIGRRLRWLMAAMSSDIMTMVLGTLLCFHRWRELADAWRLWIEAISCTWEH